MGLTSERYIEESEWLRRYWATPLCRWVMLQRYFGDLKEQCSPCGKCDVCQMGEAKRDKESAELLAEKSLVAEQEAMLLQKKAR